MATFLQALQEIEKLKFPHSKEDAPYFREKISKNMDLLYDSGRIAEIDAYFHMQGLRDEFEPIGVGAKKLAFRCRNYVATINLSARSDPVVNHPHVIHPTHYKSFISDANGLAISVEILPYYRVLENTLDSSTTQFAQMRHLRHLLKIQGASYSDTEEIPANFSILPEHTDEKPKLIIIDRDGFSPAPEFLEDFKIYHHCALECWKAADDAHRALYHGLDDKSR